MICWIYSVTLSYQAWLLEPSRLLYPLVAVSHAPSHQSLVFGAHFPKVVVAAVGVDLLLITDHIRDQIAVEVDEDTSFWLIFHQSSTTTKKFFFHDRQQEWFFCYRTDWLFLGRSREKKRRPMWGSLSILIWLMNGVGGGQDRCKRSGFWAT